MEGICKATTHGARIDFNFTVNGESYGFSGVACGYDISANHIENEVTLKLRDVVEYRREQSAGHATTLAERLRLTRTRLGYPIAEAARRAGLTRQQLWRIENGRRTLRAVELYSLSLTYETDIRQWFQEKT